MTARLRFDFYREHAASKHKLPDGWEIYKWEVVNYGTPAEALGVTGAVCTAVFSKGPRKGSRNWAKMDRATVMSIRFTDREHATFLLLWEKSTGTCSKCSGNGTVLVSWSAANGSVYGECPKCSGTGSAI